MTKTLDVILIGAGNRGRTYTDQMTDSRYRVVAVADPVPELRDYIREKHALKDEMCFESWEAVLGKPKFADLVIIATGDRLHYEPAMAAIEKGYHLLLEKPIAPTEQQCVDIANLAKEKGVKILVCHVLRYSPFFGKIKSLIDRGAVGKVISIHHSEGVGNVHQSHSYVRGKWGNLARSSNMLLAKSCHDMDIIQWLMGKPCTKVQSFGSLTHFTRENAPEGAPDYCIQGCPHGESCYYNAVKLYLDDKENLWFREASTGITKPDDEAVEAVLRNTQFGKCVYKCDNDVVDHQVVNLEFEGGETASFNMCAFTDMDRRISVMGTDGEIRGMMDEGTLTYYSFKTRERQIISTLGEDLGVSHADGHGGGDAGIVNTLYRYLTEDYGGSLLSEIAISTRNHMIAFAAEKSRLEGRVINVKKFEQEMGLVLER